MGKEIQGDWRRFMSKRSRIKSNKKRKKRSNMREEQRKRWKMVRVHPDNPQQQASGRRNVPKKRIQIDNPPISQPAGKHAVSTSIKKELPMITLNGMTYTNDSFSVHTRGLAIGFTQLGYKVSIDAWADGDRSLPIEPEVKKCVRRGSDRKIGIRISHPDTFIYLNAYEFKVGFGVCETQKIHPKWVSICNKYCDQIWTPSTFCTETFKNEGVENVFTVQEGIDARYYNKDIAPFKYPFDKDTFIFLTIGNAQERKGTQMLYEALKEEFNKEEKVGLVIKSYAPWAWGHCQFAGNGLLTPELAKKHNVTLHNDPRVFGFGKVEEYWDEKEKKWKLHLIDPQIPYNQMGSLYTGADCFVLPTKGEGFGLPVLEAKACNIPVIVTNWSGHLDFCDNNDTFLLEYTGFSKAFEQRPEQGEWVNPDKRHLKYLMRFVYENRDQAKKKADIAYKKVHEKWTWKEATKIAVKVLSLENPQVFIEEAIS